MTTISYCAFESATAPSTGRDAAATHVGRSVRDLFPQKILATTIARIAKGALARATILIRGCPATFWLRIRFFRSSGRALGTVHVLKDITERKRAEEKYRTLVSNVQEGVFISTPQGHFLISMRRFCVLRLSNEGIAAGD